MTRYKVVNGNIIDTNNPPEEPTPVKTYQTFVQPDPEYKVNPRDFTTRKAPNMYDAAVAEALKGWDGESVRMVTVLVIPPGVARYPNGNPLITHAITLAFDKTTLEGNLRCPSLDPTA